MSLIISSGYAGSINVKHNDGESTLNYRRNDINSIVEYAKENDIRQIKLKLRDLPAFEPIYEHVDKIRVTGLFALGIAFNKQTIGRVYQLGHMHKLCLHNVHESFFGHIHPDSTYSYTTDPRITRICAVEQYHLEGLIGRELDYLFISVLQPEVVEGLEAKKVVIKDFGYDYRSILRSRTLKKLKIQDEILYPVTEVNCPEIESYKLMIGGVNHRIPQLDQIIDSRRFKKMKVAPH